MLADDSASREVWLGKGGALEAVGEGTILIESSTVSPSWVAEFAELSAARGAQVSRCSGNREPNAG